MTQKSLSFVLGLVMALLSFSVVAAQDATMTPTLGSNVEVRTTLEDLTANSANYLGQQVTLEGVIEELVNVRTFVLGEGAALDDDRVLVINNSGREFDLMIRRDQQVRLLGTVYGSINQGSLTQIGATLMNTAEPDAMMTTEPDIALNTAEPGVMMTTEPGMTTTMEATLEAMPSTPVPTLNAGVSVNGMNQVDFSQMLLPDEYNDYTIVVLDSLDTITYIQVQ